MIEKHTENNKMYGRCVLCFVFLVLASLVEASQNHDSGACGVVSNRIDSIFGVQLRASCQSDSRVKTRDCYGVDIHLDGTFWGFKKCRANYVLGTNACYSVVASTGGAGCLEDYLNGLSVKMPQIVLTIEKKYGTRMSRLSGQRLLCAATSFGFDVKKIKCAYWLGFGSCRANGKYPQELVAYQTDDIMTVIHLQDNEFYEMVVKAQAKEDTKTALNSL